MMQKIVGITDIKLALNDERFRNLFPELKDSIDKFLKEPKCGSCLVPLTREILQKYPERVKEYFPGRKVITPEEEIKKLSENSFTVINCKITELEKKLRELPAGGRRYLYMARYQDEVTVVVNELNVLF